MKAVENRYKYETLAKHLTNVLISMEPNVELFETFLWSYPSRIQAEKNANGRHTMIISFTNQLCKINSVYDMDHFQSNSFRTALTNKSLCAKVAQNSKEKILSSV